MGDFFYYKFCCEENAFYIVCDIDKVIDYYPSHIIRINRRIRIQISEEKDTKKVIKFILQDIDDQFLTKTLENNFNVYLKNNRYYFKDEAQGRLIIDYLNAIFISIIMKG